MLANTVTETIRDASGFRLCPFFLDKWAHVSFCTQGKAESPQSATACLLGNASMSSQVKRMQGKHSRSTSLSHSPKGGIMELRCTSLYCPQTTRSRIEASHDSKSLGEGRPRMFAFPATRIWLALPRCLTSASSNQYVFYHSDHAARSLVIARMRSNVEAAMQFG